MINCVPSSDSDSNSALVEAALESILSDEVVLLEYQGSGAVAAAVGVDTATGPRSTQAPALGGCRIRTLKVGTSFPVTERTPSELSNKISLQQCILTINDYTAWGFFLLHPLGTQQLQCISPGEIH